MTTQLRPGAAEGPTKLLADFASAVSLDDVPADVVERMQYLILDGLGSGLFASKLIAGERAVSALAAGPDAEALVLGWDRRADPVTSATLNGAFIQGFELDDCHERGPVHSAACVLPALIALLSRRRATGPDFLAAALLGFEVGPRIGLAIGGFDLVVDGWYVGSISGTIGSAVAAARIMGLDTRGTEHAIGIAATQAGGLMSAQFESMVKRMHSGFAARNGVIGAVLADADFTGIDDVLEREYGGFAGTFTQARGYDLSHLTDGLSEEWEIRNIATKPYSSMSGTHGAVDAVKQLRTERPIDPADIEQIDIGQSKAMLLHAGWDLERPVTVTGAQMNIAYSVAVTLATGDAFVGQYAPDRLDDDAVWDIIRRVRTYHEPRFDPAGAEYGCRIAVRLRSGDELVCEIAHPRGAPGNALSNVELLDKFRELVNFVADPEQGEAVVDAVLGLHDAGDLTEFERTLQMVTRAPYAPSYAEAGPGPGPA